MSAPTVHTPNDATVPRHASPEQAQSDQAQPERRHGYEHLAPLFAERAALPDGHPRRERLRAQLIAGYLPVARHIAHRYGYRGENAQDIEQVASVGLILAVDRFDPGRDVDFLSFAVPTITGEVLRHFRDRTTTIRLPRRLRIGNTGQVAWAESLYRYFVFQDPTWRYVSMNLERDLRTRTSASADC